MPKKKASDDLSKYKITAYKGLVALLGSIAGNTDSNDAVRTRTTDLLGQVKAELVKLLGGDVIDVIVLDRPPSVRKNKKLNGIEIKFAEKPGVNITTVLGNSGFRYSFRKGHWYTNFNSESWSFANHVNNGIILVTAENSKIKQKIKNNCEKGSTAKRKYLVLYRNKRKPKMISKEGVDWFTRNPDTDIRKIYSYPGEWTADLARERIKNSHPEIEVILDTDGLDSLLSKKSEIIDRLNAISDDFSPPSHKIRVMDNDGIYYTYLRGTETFHRITTPPLYESEKTSLNALLIKGTLLVLVNVYDDSVVGSSNLRSIGRTVHEEELPRKRKQQKPDSARKQSLNDKNEQPAVSLESFFKVSTSLGDKNGQERSE
ncbi:MAG: hypothetical protein ACFFD4_19775 [Candidatus Odinarchaeota archaeon]